MTISAIFKDGVFRPIGPIKLREGEQVRIEVFRSSPSNTRTIVSLKGIWKHASPPVDAGDWVTETIADIRHESTRKLEHLAQEVSENLSHG